ncbi:hypothetical protein EI94DRAFT_1214106 [Lactarius quietus]|nr:hypothetical protein EI94DRAFT_1214106 [Lactarius quietus]
MQVQVLSLICLGLGNTVDRVIQVLLAREMWSTVPLIIGDNISAKPFQRRSYRHAFHCPHMIYTVHFNAQAIGLRFVVDLDLGCAVTLVAIVGAISRPRDGSSSAVNASGAASSIAHMNGEGVRCSAFLALQYLLAWKRSGFS